MNKKNSEKKNKQSYKAENPNLYTSRKALINHGSIIDSSYQKINLASDNIRAVEENNNKNYKENIVHEEENIHHPENFDSHSESMYSHHSK